MRGVLGHGELNGGQRMRDNDNTYNYLIKVINYANKKHNNNYYLSSPSSLPTVTSPSLLSYWYMAHPAEVCVILVASAVGSCL